MRWLDSHMLLCFIPKTIMLVCKTIAILACQYSKFFKQHTAFCKQHVVVEETTCLLPLRKLLKES